MIAKHKITTHMNTIALQLADLTYKFAYARRVCGINSVCDCSDCSECSECSDTDHSCVNGDILAYLNNCKLDRINDSRRFSHVNMDLCKLAALNGNALAALQVCVNTALSTMRGSESYDSFIKRQEDTIHTFKVYITIMKKLRMDKLVVEIGKWCYHYSSEYGYQCFNKYNCRLAIAILNAVNGHRTARRYIAAAYCDIDMSYSPHYMFIALKRAVTADDTEFASECVRRILTQYNINTTHSN